MTTQQFSPISNDELKELLATAESSLFWRGLATRSKLAERFDDLFFLSRLRKKALASGFQQQINVQSTRIAIIGGFTLYPLTELVETLLAVEGVDAELFVGQFDGYVMEVLDQSSSLYTFKPDVVVILPSESGCHYPGQLTDTRVVVQEAAMRVSKELLDLCAVLHQRTSADLLLCNFKLPAHFDPGPYRARTLASQWSFTKFVNLELGLNAPQYVHVCDVEFLANRRGALQSCDDHGWLESKQPCSPDLLVDIAKEIAHLITSLRIGPKKVLIVDLDNTLWGGIIGDDGIEGIELGQTSPRGQAFRVFQEYLLSLSRRGVLLGVCSKNDQDKALEPFEKHPEMLLKRDHFVTFKANWQPKPDNLRLIAEELNLGLDSFVFVDDDAVEIDMVKRFTPEVSTILLSSDPSEYVRQLQEVRLFEPLRISAEDLDRTQQYRQESLRKNEATSFTDVGSYLASLNMMASFTEFQEVDVPRICQLINKSNQFNVTTRRRTEAEVLRLMADANHVCFSTRLGDKFGDYGLIGVVVAQVDRSLGASVLEVDTWVMSCRVLSRGVEEEMMNEIMRLAKAFCCAEVRAVYIPTTKNQLVKTLYPRFGFRTIEETATHSEYSRDVQSYRPFSTKIDIIRRTFLSAEASNQPHKFSKPDSL